MRRAIVFVLALCHGVSRLAYAAPADAPRTLAASGQPLWRSPTAGGPLVLSFVPSEARAFVSWRVAETLEHAQAPLLVAALGPLGQWCRETLPRLSGVPLAKIERLTVALCSADRGSPPMTLVIESIDALDGAKLEKSLAWTMEKRVEEETIYRRNDERYWLPTSAGGRTIVVAPSALMESIIEQRDGGPRMQREIEELRAASDGDRLFNLLAPPDYWTSGGKGLFDEAEFERIRDWLSWMFGSASRAALLSLHLDDQFFAELRVICSADQKPLLFARDWRRRLDQVSGRVEQQLGGRELVDYNRAVLKRYPRMLEVLSRFTRQSVEGRQLVLRAYLPAVAAHNLALATRLFFERSDAAPDLREETSP